MGSSLRMSDDLRTREVNLRDLLAHKVGVPPYFGAFMTGFDADITREELVRFVNM